MATAISKEAFIQACNARKKEEELQRQREREEQRRREEEERRRQEEQRRREEEERRRQEEQRRQEREARLDREFRTTVNKLPVDCKDDFVYNNNLYRIDFKNRRFIKEKTNAGGGTQVIGRPPVGGGSVVERPPERNIRASGRRSFINEQLGIGV